MTEAAEDDLAEIWAFIALEASEATATRVLASITGKLQVLLEFPLAAPAREDLAPGLRATRYRDYVIFFLVDADRLTVVRVLHGARDIEAIAQDGGFND